jgi:hypothetical protein
MPTPPHKTHPRSCSENWASKKICPLRP